MNFYVTFGTSGYLESLQKKVQDEGLLLMHGKDTAILMHETMNQSSFKSGKKYEVIDLAGTLTDGKFAALNNIPVSQEGRPIFEYRFKQRAGSIEQSEGFIAFRLLRPLDSDTYIVLTLWEHPNYFKRWKDSKAFEKAHQKKHTSDQMEHNKQIFPRPSYVTTYFALAPEEEEE